MIKFYAVIIVSLILFLKEVNAAPEKMTVYFLSRGQTFGIEQNFRFPLYREQFIQRHLSFQYGLFPLSPLFATETPESKEQSGGCIPMTDGCFHPQYGFKPRKVSEGFKHSTTLPPPVEVPVHVHSQESNLIHCDRGHYFDLYCGQAQKSSSSLQKPSLEIWFDISSSLREIDYSENKEHCFRRKFWDEMAKKCSGKILGKVYNTTIKEFSENESVCFNFGTNNSKKLEQWLRDSEAKHLILVTDVDELEPSLEKLFFELGAKIIGDGVKPMTPQNLVDEAKHLATECER